MWFERSVKKMREILFRGKRADNGEWVYGHLLEQNTPDCHSYIVMSIIAELDNRHIEIMEFDINEVIPETVGQFTGLTDKNGVRIFEGDILRGFEYPFCSNINGEFNYFAEIVWFDDSSAFGTYTFKNPKSNVRGISEGNTDYLEYFNADKWEVIGNIHDNPELLEGGEGNG